MPKKNNKKKTYFFWNHHLLTFSPDSSHRSNIFLVFQSIKKLNFILIDSNALVTYSFSLYFPHWFQYVLSLRKRNHSHNFCTRIKIKLTERINSIYWYFQWKYWPIGFQILEKSLQCRQKSGRNNQLRRKNEERTVISIFQSHSNFLERITTIARAADLEKQRTKTCSLYYNCYLGKLFRKRKYFHRIVTRKMFSMKRHWLSPLHKLCC